MFRKVFIILGAGSGNDIREFYRHYGKEGWEIYAWEAHPQMTKVLEQRYSDINVISAAASTENGEVKLYLGKKTNNSSIDVNKTNVKESAYHTVKSIDFVEWFKKRFSETDEIVLVMDIEGAEFPLLEKMRDEGVMNYISEFYMEFHGRKLEGFDMKIEEDWIAYLIAKFGSKVYICKVYQHEKFAILNSEEKPKRQR